MEKYGYKLFAKYYDAFYRKKDYSKETQFLIDLLKKNQVKTVLDVGCGTGNHLKLLEEAGFKCTGMDYNVEMLDVARTKVKGDLHVGDMAKFRLDKTFDAIVSMFAVFNHNPDEKSALQTLERMQALLNQGGLLLLDLYHAKDSGQKTDEAEGAKRHMKWAYDPVNKMTTTSIEYHTPESDIVQDPFVFRIFSQAEMTKLLQEAGFTQIQFFENYTFNPAQDNSKNLIAFGKKA